MIGDTVMASDITLVNTTMSGLLDLLFSPTILFNDG